MIPATIPAVVRTSLKPNRPNQIGHPVAGGEHQGSQAEPGDHLEQEQPADGGDVLEPGQIQVKVDRGGGRQQPRPRDPERWPQPGAGRCHLCALHNLITVLAASWFSTRRAAVQPAAVPCLWL